MPDTESSKEAFDRLRAVRAESLDHYRRAQELFLLRQKMMRELIDQGFTQADIGRELGVSRQAVQQMLSR